MVPGTTHRHLSKKHSVRNLDDRHDEETVIIIKQAMREVPCTEAIRLVH